jgi:hypothetical protein
MPTLTERAAAFRTELRKAIKSNVRFKRWPDGARASVRCDTGSMYQCIVVAVSAPAEWAVGPYGLTDEAKALGAELTDWLARFTEGAWGTVTINDFNAGSVARAGWRPGED